MKPLLPIKSRSWPLWLSWLALVGALVVEHFAQLSALGHQVSEVAILGAFLVVVAQMAQVL